MKDYVIFAGDVALDEYYSAMRWPAIKEKISVETLPAQCGGMIANAACVYASMGTPTRFMGLMNDGLVTQRLLKDLEKSGVDTGLVLYDNKLPDSKTIIILAEGEHTVFIPALHIERIELKKEQFDALCGASYIYSTASEMRRLRFGEMGFEEIIAAVRSAGAKIIYDLDVGYLEKEDERFYRNINIAIFNEIGFNGYMGTRTAKQAVGDLLSYGTEAVVITKAENGCTVYSSGGCFDSPALPAKVVDVTGAGDTFCAAFLHAYRKTGDLEHSARFANTAACICVESVGPRAGAVGENAVLERMSR